MSWSLCTVNDANCFMAWGAGVKPAPFLYGGEDTLESRLRKELIRLSSEETLHVYVLITVCFVNAVVLNRGNPYL
jgi:hypothetical protein